MAFGQYYIRISWESTTFMIALLPLEQLIQFSLNFEWQNWNATTFQEPKRNPEFLEINEGCGLLKWAKVLDTL